MDIISFSEAATANSRIESFIENPDSMSGIVTVPKVIASGENVTIPAGRVAVLPNVQVDGVLNIEGEVFIPSGANFSGVVEKQPSNITVNVGAGQTYTTINQALEYLSGFYPLYKTTGVTATINLKAGFVMAEQVLISGLNLGWINIIGEDAETQIDYTKINQPFYGYGPIFGCASGGKMPNILHQFKYPTVGNGKDGILVIGSGSACDVVNGGVIGASGRGISVVGEAIAYILDADFSGSGTYGVYNSGAKVSVINTNARKIATDTTADIFTVAAGITYIDPLTTGGFNITPNTVTSSGIVLK